MNVRLLAALALAATTFGAPAVAAESTLHVGAAYVTKTGSGPRALILIPGLGCGAWTYDRVVPSLAKRYTVYTVTFAGFSGAPPIAGPPYLDAFAKSITDLVAQEHLTKPVLVGHSLGGALALRIAAEMPDLPGAVLAIDSLPQFPIQPPGQTSQERAEFIKAFRDGMLAAPADGYAVQARKSVAGLVGDSANVEFITAETLKSDRTTFANAAAELALTDLHPLLPKITAPVTVFAAVPSEAQAQQFEQFYTLQYAGTPQLTVRAVAPAKHFLMFDAPEKFQAALDAFLARV